MRSPRFWVVTLLMSFTMLVLHVRGDQDRVLPSRPLSELPTTFGSRVATEFPLDEETLETLGKGDFLNRMYAYPSAFKAANPNELAPIGLFIGYFPTQRTGQSIHSPQHCLPGAGWVFVESGVTDLTDTDGTKRTVGEYLINNGRSSQEVLYWYQLHGRSIASDYTAKIYTLADSIRYGRTDEALVRIMTPVNPGEDRLEAHNRAVRFAEQIIPLLPAYVPNLVQ
jgi:EpsI family protein